MNELQVVVNQEVGKINWNFEELKTALAMEMERYKGLSYDDSSVSEAKKDVAYLRKLKSSVEDRRKEIKSKCLEPYEALEKQAKELTRLIDEPINLIDKKVKGYEEEQRKKKKEEILAYMTKAFAGIPEILIVNLTNKVYDSRWENKSTTKKSWQEVINAAAESTRGDLSILDGIEEEFRDTASEVYSKNLVLSEALSKVQELRRQKEMILERERKRREAEEARKREEEAEKTSMAIKEATDAIVGAIPKVNERGEVVESEPTTPIGKAIKDSLNKGAQEMLNAYAEEDRKEQQPAEERKILPLQIVGTEEQINKILAYIRFVGAECRRG